MFVFASVGLPLVRFTLTMGAGVPENYVLLLVLIKMIIKTLPFHYSVIIMYIHRYI